MKGAINVRVVLGIGLLAFGSAHALAGPQVAGDGQEQARLLLSGGRDSSYGPAAGLPYAPPAAGKSIALDAQAQAREMILGRQIAKSQGIDVKRLLAGGGAPDRKDAPDPHEMARSMILGSHSAGSSPKIRLTGKTEQLKRRPGEAQ
jgi:hypothetical protein